MNAESQHTPEAAVSSSNSAGAMLRHHRKARGVEPETLASSLHVPVSKILALEEDRLDVMPDIMFARALAMSVCRYLKVDATAVLARMPQQDASRVAARDERGIDSPLSRPSLMPDGSAQIFQRLLDVKVLAVLVVVLGLLYLWVQGGNQPAPVAPPSAPALAEPVPNAVPATEGSAPTDGQTTTASGAAAPTSVAVQPVTPALPQTVVTPVTPAGVGK